MGGKLSVLLYQPFDDSWFGNVNYAAGIDAMNYGVMEERHQREIDSVEERVGRRDERIRSIRANFRTNVQLPRSAVDVSLIGNRYIPPITKKKELAGGIGSTKMPFIAKEILDSSDVSDIGGTGL